MSEHYQGSCHCGAIKFSYDGDKIEKALRCNCSLCSRKGAIMTPQTIPIETLTIEAESGVLGLYQFGAETAKHFFVKAAVFIPSTKQPVFQVNIELTLVVCMILTALTCPLIYLMAKTCSKFKRYFLLKNQLPTVNAKYSDK